MYSQYKIELGTVFKYCISDFLIKFNYAFILLNLIVLEKNKIFFILLVNTTI